jgi:hypothetical protein
MGATISKKKNPYLQSVANVLDILAYIQPMIAHKK